MIKATPDYPRVLNDKTTAIRFAIDRNGVSSHDFLYIQYALVADDASLTSKILSIRTTRRGVPLN